MRTNNKWITVLGAVALGVVALQLNPQEVTAADHTDTPDDVDGGPADIGDFYAWHTEDGNLVSIVTFNAGIGAGGDPVYDDTVLYTIHIDNTGDIAEQQDFLDNDNDNESDIQIYIRFGANNAGDWGVQVAGLPGADEDPLVGPVDEALTSGGATVWCGLADDPFFFDFEAFVTTVGNLLDDTDAVDIAFSPGASTDTFAGSNTMACVVSVETDLAADGNNFLQLWATTGTR